MIKTSLGLLFFLISSFLYSQTSFNIAGETRLEFNGKPILLLFMDAEDNGAVEIVTTKVENGKFHFRGKIETTNLFGEKSINDMFIIALESYSQREYSGYNIKGYLEEGNIIINLDTISHISGTPKNGMLEEYYKLDRTPFSKKHIEFIKNNTDNFIGPMAFRSYYQEFSDNDINEILAAASEDFRNNEEVNICIKSREIIKSIKNEDGVRLQIVGTKCSDFELTTSLGETKRLYDYIRSSKYTVLDFWASWCGPCIASMPHLKTLAEKYKSKGVEVIGLSLDTEENEQAWLNAVKRINVPWVQLSDLKGTDSELAKSFAVSDVPYCVIVNDEGTIIDCIRFPIRYLEPALEKLP